MAGIANREWSWNVTVLRGDSAVDSANVIAWDADSSVPVVNVLTDSIGEAPEQSLAEVEYSVTLTDTTDSDAKTPHVVAIAQYGKQPLSLGLTFVSPRADTLLVTDNGFVVATKAQARANSLNVVRLAHDSDQITVVDSATWQTTYELAQWAVVEEPQKTFPAGVSNTNDGNNFNVEYDIKVTPTNRLNLITKNITLASGKIAEIDSSDITNGTVTGNVQYTTKPSATTTDLDITGNVTFAQAGTYNFNGCDLGTLVNTSGGAVVVNLTNSSFDSNAGPNITTNNNVTLTITCVDQTGNPILGARVFLETTPGGTDLINALTDSSGQVASSFNYASDQAVVGRAGKATGSPFYKPANFTGTITSGGFSTTQTLILDE